MSSTRFARFCDESSGHWSVHPVRRGFIPVNENVVLLPEGVDPVAEQRKIDIGGRSTDSSSRPAQFYDASPATLRGVHTRRVNAPPIPKEPWNRSSWRAETASGVTFPSGGLAEGSASDFTDISGGIPRRQTLENRDTPASNIKIRKPTFPLRLNGIAARKTSPSSRFSPAINAKAMQHLSTYLTPPQATAFKQGKTIEFINKQETHRLLLTTTGSFRILTGQTGEGIVEKEGRILENLYPFGDEVATFLAWFHRNPQNLIDNWGCGNFTIQKPYGR